MNTHRWVPLDKHSWLSLASRIEGILRFGDRETLITTIKEHFTESLEVYISRTEKDVMVTSKKKKLLAFIFERLGKEYARW
jgi:hypothetical protein